MAEAERKEREEVIRVGGPRVAWVYQLVLLEGCMKIRLEDGSIKANKPVTLIPYHFNWLQHDQFWIFGSQVTRINVTYVRGQHRPKDNP